MAVIRLPGSWMLMSILLCRQCRLTMGNVALAGLGIKVVGLTFISLPGVVLGLFRCRDNLLVMNGLQFRNLVMVCDLGLCYNMLGGLIRSS